jgi:antitoxin YefM
MRERPQAPDRKWMPFRRHTSKDAMITSPSAPVELLGLFSYAVRQPRTTFRALPMDSTTVNKFRESLKSFVEQVVDRHMPLRVTRRNGADFVVMSAEDWERDQETLHVLQNSNLLRQIADSSATHAAGTGYTPTQEQLDEIIGV